MSSIPEKINALVKAHKAIIFSKTTCPYCTNAKRAFAAMGVSPHVIELDSDPACSEWQAALSKLTGASTSVPKVFVNGAFLGGGDDTVAAHKSGQLAKLCKEAGLL